MLLWAPAWMYNPFFWVFVLNSSWDHSSGRTLGVWFLYLSSQLGVLNSLPFTLAFHYSFVSLLSICLLLLFPFSANLCSSAAGLPKHPTFCSIGDYIWSSALLYVPPRERICCGSPSGEGLQALCHPDQPAVSISNTVLRTVRARMEKVQRNPSSSLTKPCLNLLIPCR